MVRLRPPDKSDHRAMPGLIEGLPDAVALRCLARVPLHLHRKLELVSRSWRNAVHSTELFRARREVDSTEDLVFVSACEPNNLWQAYHAAHDLWTTVPRLPSSIRYLAHFGSVAARGRLYVLGGGSDAIDLLTGDQEGRFATDEVWSYDPVSRKWAPCAPMLEPRAMFACCELDGRIVVAGGFASCRKSTAGAEVYDPEEDSWAPLPELNRVRDSVCTGAVVDGKVHVFHKGSSAVQVLEAGSAGLTWTVRDGFGWAHGPMAVAGGGLYIVNRGQIYRVEGDSSTMVASGSGCRRKVGFGVIGVGDDVYVVGGVFVPEGMNWDIVATADVEVLGLGKERAGWRRVAPMTRCEGIVLGCAALRI